jgi:hypothetical protein
MKSIQNEVRVPLCMNKYRGPSQLLCALIITSIAPLQLFACHVPASTLLIIIIVSNPSILVASVQLIITVYYVYLYIPPGGPRAFDYLELR